MEVMMDKYFDGQPIDSKDPRAIMAIAGRMAVDNHSMTAEQIKTHFPYPQEVDKTMPLYWDFLADTLTDRAA